MPSEQIVVNRIAFDAYHLWELRRACGGHLLHAVPKGASQVSGRALCGFIPSGSPKYIADRHGWDRPNTNGVLNRRPCSACKARSPGFFRETLRQALDAADARERAKIAQEGRS